MRFISILIVAFLFPLSSADGNKVNLNFKNIKIEDLIKFIGKIRGKNVLMLDKVSGTVDFTPNRPVDKDDIIDIVNDVLYEKGYAVVESRGTLKVVKASLVSRYPLPVVSGNSASNQASMITSVIKLTNENSDLVAAKVRHLISKNAKLVTNKESNTLIITDFPKNIDTIMKIVDMMQKGNTKYTKTLHLKNIKAANIITQLNNISKNLYNQTINSEKVSIIEDKSSNALIFIGKRENVQKLVSYAKDSDNADSMVKSIVDVIYLKNADVKNVLKIVNDLISKKQYVDPSLKPNVSADEESNMLVLSGVREEIEEIKELIDMLDRDKRQVYVRAKVIEVSEDKVDDIGIKYGIAGGKSGSKGLISFAASLAVAGGSAISLGGLENFVDTPENLTEGLALGAAVNFMKQNGALEVVSEPSILCVNNKESSIYVGETRSFKTSEVQNTSGNPTVSFSREDIGLSLKIKPRISNDRKVSLEITTVLEDVDDSTTNGQPNTTKKEVKTSAIVTNGQNVIIGGLIKNKDSSTVDKVPLFGDLPLVGHLFTNDRGVVSQRNLVIIITPYIISKSAGLTTIREKLTRLDAMEQKLLEKLERELEKKRASKEHVYQYVDEEEEDAFTKWRNIGK
jgi:general secretion pathway protein D